MDYHTTFSNNQKMVSILDRELGLKIKMLMKCLISSVSVFLLLVTAKKCHFMSELLCATQRRTDQSPAVCNNNYYTIIVLYKRCSIQYLFC